MKKEFDITKRDWDHKSVTRSDNQLMSSIADRLLANGIIPDKAPKLGPSQTQKNVAGNGSVNSYPNIAGNDIILSNIFKG